MEPSSNTHSLFPRHLKDDLLASFVVFLIALPLSMGIAVASGAPPAAGIVTGIVGGLVAGRLAGCSLQVSGPAAGLTVIVWQLIQTYGMETLGTIVLLAGILQILAASLQLGQWFRAVSPSVIHGMLAGIGMLIVASQFHVMVDDLPKGTGLDNLLTMPSAIWKVVSPTETSSHHLAAGIGLLTIGVMVLWESFAPTWARPLPGLLVGVGIATSVATLAGMTVSHVNVRDNLLTIIQLPQWDTLAHLLETPILASALALAFIASVETLLSATAVDQMHTGARTRYNRELFSQGIGNMVCGVLGVLPMTGVLVRSAANVQAGGRTRVSTMLHGAWLLLFVAFLPFILRLIPTASLAAVLVFTGYKLMNIRMIRELKAYGRSEVAIYAGTLIAIVTTNLLTGVVIGIGLAIAKLLYTTQNLETQLTHAADGRTVSLHLMGIATFIGLPRLATALEQIPPGTEVRLQFDSLRHIDHACLNLLESWKRLHEHHGGEVILDWDKLRGRSYQARTASRGPESMPESPHPDRRS
jgi:MFS superfamily sulfate permease-like transporter